MAKSTKKRNPQDATLRNTRSLVKRLLVMEKTARSMRARIAALEELSKG